VSQDWDIKPRSGKCQVCEAGFGDGHPCYTSLTFDAAGYQRVDCCEACWPHVQTRPGRYSSWKGVYRLPPPEPDRRVRKETAESLLRFLLERKEPVSRGTLYVLAVMLERQRVFVERAVQPDAAGGGRVIVFEHRKTGETFAVPDPQLKLTDLEPVQQDVMRLLSAPLPAKPVEPAQNADAPSP